jgi:hypothetical protein
MGPKNPLKKLDYIFFSSKNRDNDVVNDPAVKQVVVEQTKQWSDMMERFRTENWDLMKTHLQAQEEILRKLMQTQQQSQMKDLETLFEKYVFLSFGNYEA